MYLALVAFTVTLYFVVHCETPDLTTVCQTFDRQNVCVPIADCPGVTHRLKRGENVTICRLDATGSSAFVCCDLNAPSYPTSAEKCDVYKRMSSQQPLRHNSLNRSENTEFRAIETENAGACRAQGQALSATDAISGRTFAHLVYLAYAPAEINPDYHCDGSLISENFVLTSAYCVKMERIATDGRPYAVQFVKIANPNAVDDNHRVPVQERIVHPEFIEDSHTNNIGLVRLDRLVPISSQVVPICLPQLNGVPANQARVVEAKLTKTYRNTKQFTFYEAAECVRTDISAAICGTPFAHGINGSQHFCVRADDKTTLNDGIYHYDIGGPLQIDHSTLRGMRTIVGVSSHVGNGAGIHKISVPIVFIKVYNYVGWIEGIVWPNG